MDATRHAGTVAIVTGAASGIGRATAARLAREGAAVVATDVDPDGLAALAAELSAEGIGIDTPAGDVSDAADVDRIVAAATAHGPVGILANVAGIMDFFLPVGDLDDATWDRVMAVNVTGPMRLCRALVEPMADAGGGVIVNISSIAGLCGGAAGVAYTASKHALNGLTRSIAYFYGPRGVRCSAICPGGVETNIGATTAQPRVEWAWERLQPSFARGQRVAQPDEIASLVSWLASDDAVNVNGALLTSDGGWTAA